MMRIFLSNYFSRQVLALFAAVLALSVVSGFTFFMHLKHIGHEIVSNWLRIEEPSIQQGNIFASLAANHRMYVSSGLIKSVIIYDIKGEQMSEMASFGDHTTFESYPVIKPGEVITQVAWPYSSIVYVNFSVRPNLLAIFRIESRASAVLFLVMYSMLLLLIICFNIYLRLLARKEDYTRISLIKTALDNLLDEQEPGPSLTEKLPDLKGQWEPIRARFVDLKEHLIISAKHKVISQTSAMLSHDMRAPLGTFERLLHIPADSFDDMRGAIRESLKRLHMMIESLRHTDVEVIITRSYSSLDFSMGLEGLRGKASDRSISIVTRLDNIERAWVDLMKFERAWVNLVSNGIAAAESKVEIELKKSDNDLIIRVLDDGSGVPEEFLPRLFQRGATHGKADGTGLGLAYVRQIMHGHGGDVRYYRENDMTVFECFLPSAVAAMEEMKEAGVVEKPENPQQEQRVQPDIRQVSICFNSDLLNQRVHERLSKIATETHTFLTGFHQNSSIVLTNFEEMAEMAMAADKRIIMFDDSLSDEEILRRAPIRLGLRG